MCAWANVDTHEPDALCERCIRGLSEFAQREGLDVPWKDAWAVYQEARERYTEPVTTSETLLAMSVEEQNRIYEGACLT